MPIALAKAVAIALRSPDILAKPGSKARLMGAPISLLGKLANSLLTL